MNIPFTIAIIVVVLVAIVVMARARRQGIQRAGEVFQAYLRERHGTALPVPTAENQTIFDLFDHPKERVLEVEIQNANPMTGTQLITAAQGRITIGSHQVIVAFGQAGDDDQASPVIYWHAHLSGVLSGWARLRSVASRYQGLIRETELESIEFNRDVQVHASPSKLAYALFSPDFMDWYLHTSHRPWIYVDKNLLVIVVEGMIHHDRLLSMESEVLQIIEFVEKSGALEPVEVAK